MSPDEQKPAQAGKKSPRKTLPPGSLRGRVRAHDPFELIRWLAMSQPDPRKALAELVQNSLDAGAKRITISRLRERGVVCLRILDDGEGVIPEMTRTHALKYIATHIGHSRKRKLSPQERMQLMTQGQYGIGLLGFWSLGEILEMRSSVPGQKPHRLVLHRDRPTFEVEPLPGQIDLGDRWTEVVVRHVHREAMGPLIGRRAADYLASELRGQLLARGVELWIEDRISRQRGDKRIPVLPRRFLGTRLEGLGPISVPGHSPVRLEIYYRGDAGETDGEDGLALYSAGTLVAPSFNELAPLGLDRSPWTDRRLTGLVDFPAFRVVPGSRRGVFVDDAAAAFAHAVQQVEPLLLGVLKEFEQKQAREEDRTLVRTLKRALRDFYRQRPRYAMLAVQDPRAGVTGDPSGTAGPGSGDEPGPGRGEDSEADSAAGEDALPSGVEASADATPDVGDGIAPPEPQLELLPPGPLASVRLQPASVRMECETTRNVRALALDASGRPIEDPVDFAWRLEGEAVVFLALAPTSVRLEAGREPGRAALMVTARSGDVLTWAEARVDVVQVGGLRGGDEGIPEPEFANCPGQPWRSRMMDGRWQVNTGHPEFEAVSDRPALKLRYLAMLFAKEVVMRNHQDPRLDQPLEQLIEIAAYADQRLSAKGRRRGGIGDEDA